MLSGTLCGAMLGMFWVLAQARWQQIDPQDPGKALAREVFDRLAARTPNAAEEKLQGNFGHVEDGQAVSGKDAAAGHSG